jgi:hypothetical protein
MSRRGGTGITGIVSITATIGKREPAINLQAKLISFP